MSLRPSELAQVVEELGAALAGAAVQKIWAPSPQRVYLSLRQPGRTVLLLLCTEPNVARLAISAARPVGQDPEAEARQRFFRQELVGTRLRTIVQTAPRAAVVVLENPPETERRLLVDLGSGARVLLRRESEPLGTEHPARLPLEGEGPPSRLVPGQPPFPFATAAEALLSGGEREGEEAALRRALAAPLQAKLKRLKRTLTKVTAEAERGPAAERHRQLGELLRHHVASLPRGEREVTLTEYAMEGPREVKVPLDPSLPPREQVERHFHQYRRLQRGSERAAQRLEELAAERARTQAELERLASLPLEALREEGGSRARAPRPAAAEPRKPFREHLTAAGERIWVGRGGADNDALTFGVARPEHWWLHARGVPGAHVVVPLARGAELTPELLLDAAHLALHHSERKGEGQGEVSYTRVKFVRRVKDGAPGQVTYTREKTFWLRVEPARLERLLRE